MGGLAPVGVLAVLYQAVACCRGSAACPVCGGKALAYVLVNLAVDLAYLLIDPRIRGVN